jgi:hypothetical protein
MPTTINEGARAADWLKAEAGSYYSRGTGIVAAGSGVLLTGTVLAKVTATGKFVPAAASGADGSQIAVAVLFSGADGKFTLDATSADKPAVIVERDAIASHAGLVYGATVNDAVKRAAANGQLKAVGILVREGA